MLCCYTAHSTPNPASARSCSASSLLRRAFWLPIQMPVRCSVPSRRTSTWPRLGIAPIYHAATGRYLGPADLADQATSEQVSAFRRARVARTRRLRKDLQASQRERYAAATQAEPARRLGALSTAEAEAELAQATGTDLSDLALPDLIPPAAHPTTEPK